MMSFKRFVVSAVFASAAGLSQAAGVYDGVWSVTVGGVPVGYYSVHQNGTQLLAASLPMVNSNTSSWEALLGTISGANATLTTLVSGVNASFSLVFTSPAAASVTQTACTPKAGQGPCSFTNGTVLQAVKIF